MEIVVKRIAKKKTYTIGHLYILNDKDVKRTWRSGVKIGDKRIFEHSFDKTKLDKEHYFVLSKLCSKTRLSPIFTPERQVRFTSLSLRI